MRIDIVSDTICPWCFIGKRRLASALEARPGLAVEIHWRPFQLNPDMPREGMDRRAYVAAKFGSEANSAEIYARVAAAGESAGIAFNFGGIPRTPNTLDSHRLIRWAAESGVQDQIVELLFRRYFIEAQDIGDRRVLTEVAKEAGMDGAWVAEALAGDADLELVRGEDKFARELGISGVPCFILEGKYAISGAQEPAVFLQAFDRIAAEAVDAAPTTT